MRKYKPLVLKFKREEINWIDPIYLTKEVARDLAEFWVNAEKNRIYCARQTELGIAHYFFDTITEKWTFDYFTDVMNREEFTEDRGRIIPFDNTKAVINNDGIICLISESGQLLGEISIEISLKWMNADDIELSEIDIKLLTYFIFKKAKRIAYYGEYKYVTFDTELFKEFLIFKDTMS